MQERGSIDNLYKAFRLFLKNKKEIKLLKEEKKKKRLKNIENATKLGLMISITVFFRFIIHLIPTKEDKKEILKIDIKKTENLTNLDKKIESLKEKVKKTEKEMELIEIRDEMVDIYKVTTKKNAEQKVKNINQKAKIEILNIDKKIEKNNPLKEEPKLDLGKIIVPIMAVSEEIIDKPKKEIKEKKPEIKEKTKSYKEEIKKLKEEIKNTNDATKLKAIKEKLKKIEDFSENKLEKDEINKINKEANKEIKKIENKEKQQKKEEETLKTSDKNVDIEAAFEIKKASYIIMKNIDEHKKNIDKSKYINKNFKRNVIFNIIGKTFATISLSNILFKNKQIRMLMNAVTVNNGLRSLRNLNSANLTYIDIKEIEYTKDKIKHLTTKILDNSLYQIQKYKQEFLNNYRDSIEHDSQLMSIYNELNEMELYIYNQFDNINRKTNRLFKTKGLIR